MTPTTTTDAMLTNAQVWQALRVLFGTRLGAGTLSVVTHHADGVIMFTTYTFPQEENDDA